jgi:hypothetical protein
MLKPIVQGLAAVWLVLFLVSFVSLRAAEQDENFQGSLSRVVAFLTWQALALGVAAIGAFAARQAIARRVEKIKLVGYGPLAVSVFLVASFIAIMAFRFYVMPWLEAQGLI